MLEKGALIERFFYMPDGAAKSEEEDWPGLINLSPHIVILIKEDIGYPRHLSVDF